MGENGSALLPRLDRVAVKRQIAGEDPRAIVLARTLTELGIADPNDWQRSVSGYVHRTLDRWIRQHGRDVVRDEFSLDATLSNTTDPSSSEDLDPNLLYLTVGANAAGYFVLGPTVDLLKPADPRLPVTFYHLLVDAVGRWVRVYDYRDALERVEMWKNWIEGEANAEEYEIPEVGGSIPAAMKEKPLSIEALRRLITSLQDERIRRLLDAAVNLDRISRASSPPEISESTREAFMDANPPLPGLVVSFKRQDAIMGCFDEESETMLEVTPEPCFLAEINPQDTRSVRRAFDSLAALSMTLTAASRLARLLPGNSETEAQDEGTCRDRGDS
ncbi:MAG TPA: hypothetical protein VGX94_01730 [Terriglobia bacterium]|nr:hypothetical protein [Terriglobia bacterium]